MSSSSSISELIAKLEAYSQDESSGSAPTPSDSGEEDWLESEEERREAVGQLAEELVALQSIYTDEGVHLLRLGAGEATTTDPDHWRPGTRITLAISTEVEEAPIRIAVTLPAFYPRASKPPQLQLLSRYVGGFSVDHILFGEILRAFYHNPQTEASHASLTWTPGEVVLFEGIEWVKEKVAEWSERREQANLESAKEREKQSTKAAVTTFEDDSQPATEAPAPAPAKRFEGTITTAPEIVDRKSVFVGYAARIENPEEVPLVLSHILSDKRVARATHPIINAWVCQTKDGVVHRDCDDDGESAAGGRLAHLLSLLVSDKPSPCRDGRANPVTDPAPALLVGIDKRHCRRDPLVRRRPPRS